MIYQKQYQRPKIRRIDVVKRAKSCRLVKLIRRYLPLNSGGDRIYRRKFPQAAAVLRQETQAIAIRTQLRWLN